MRVHDATVFDPFAEYPPACRAYRSCEVSQIVVIERSPPYGYRQGPREWGMAIARRSVSRRVQSSARVTSAMAGSTAVSVMAPIGLSLFRCHRNGGVEFFGGRAAIALGADAARGHAGLDQEHRGDLDEGGRPADEGEARRRAEARQRLGDGRAVDAAGARVGDRCRARG